MNKLIKTTLFCKKQVHLAAYFRKYSTNENVHEKQNDQELHIPVMLNEVIKYLVDDKQCENFKNYVDMTFGAGGHSTAILEKNPNSIVFALDRDPKAFDLAKNQSLKYPGRLFPMNAKFSDLDKHLNQLNVKENTIDAALIDCGASSIQFDNADRGFSVSRDGPLDMRMGCNDEKVSAEDVVNKLDEESIGRILWKYGEERLYKKIAHGIVYFRNDHGPIKTTKQLADVIATIVKQNRTDSMNRPTHVATKVFQSLRIFVNNELNELSNGISIIHRYLRPGGRLAVITFHSLEDRIVKSHFNDVSLEDTLSESESDVEKKRKKKFQMNKNMDLTIFSSYVRNLWTPLNKKVLVPSGEEIAKNPRSRSAKLRVAIKN